MSDAAWNWKAGKGDNSGTDQTNVIRMVRYRTPTYNSGRNIILLYIYEASYGVFKNTEFLTGFNSF